MADTRANNDNAEIVDFRETLNQIVEEENKVYGKKNKPRDQDPSMFQLLSWAEDDQTNADYTTKNKELISTSALGQFKYKINKSSTNWVSENMDQYRKFAYSPEKKSLLVDLHDPQKLLKKQTAPISKTQADNQEINADLIHPVKKDVYVASVPQKASENIDKFAIQKIQSLDQVLDVIESRDLNKNGELVKAVAKPHRQQKQAEEEARQQQIQLQQEEEIRRLEEAQQNDEQPEEDVSIEKLDFTNVKSRILENKVRKAKALDPVKDKDRLDRRLERIKKLNETTRWLPNSAFMTYFGRPPFENYGRGNVNPTIGGTVYGNYLKTHNVNPHKQGNHPEFKQVYGHAELAATALPISQPEPPRKCKEDFRLNQAQVEELKHRNPLFPEKNAEEGQRIVKPDLMTSLRFASEENTPDNSPTIKTKKPVNLRESLKNLSKAARAIRQDNIKKKEDFEQGKRGKSVGNRKTEESVAEKVPEKQTATPQRSTKADKKQEETKFVENKIKQEADLKAKSTVESNLREQLGSTKQSQPAAKSQTATQSIIRPAPALTVTTPKKEIKAQVFEKPQASPKVQFDETRSTLNKAATAGVIRGEPVQTEISQAQTGQEKVWDKINQDLSSTTGFNDTQPPKNYLFSLSTKETNPKFYKNVPAVWLGRIPRAGKKNPESENIKNIFNYEG